MRKISFYLLILMSKFCFATTGIQITHFKVFDDSSSYPVNKKVVLAYKPQHIGIKFIDSTDKQPNYRIKLLGSENVNWISIGNQNFMSYSNLFGGDYEFLVENTHTQKTCSLRFSIKPAFWQQWWFIPLLTLYIFVVLGIIFYLFLQYKFRNKQRTQLIKDNIARDLHDDVGSTLSSISMLSQVVKNQLPNAPENTLQLLNEISFNAQEMLENMSDIVWTTKVLNQSFDELLIRMQEHTAKILEPKNIEYEFEIIPRNSKPDWNSQQLYDFYMIFKESLNNSLKYAEAKKITISIHKKQHHIELLIKDIGKGFDTESCKMGNGITNMKKRALNLNADLSLISSPNLGTSIQLTVPY
jgi:two-component sensor histidine kinase